MNLSSNKLVVFTFLLLGLSFLFGSNIIRTGIITGTFVTAAVALIYTPMPLFFKKMVRKTWLLWDIIITGLVLVLFPGTTATSIVTAGTVGLLTTIALHYEIGKLINHGTHDR